MKINLIKVAIAAGVGVADEMIERQDAKTNKKGLKGWTFRGRAIAVIGGHALGMFLPKYGDMGETIATAATPLLTKSIVSYFMDKPAVAHTGFTPRDVRVGPASRNWTPAGGSNPGGYRGIQ